MRLSTDHGETWNNVDSPTNNALVKIKFPEKNEIVFIHSHNHIWKANIYDLITYANPSRDLPKKIDIYPNPA